VGGQGNGHVGRRGRRVARAAEASRRLLAAQRRQLPRQPVRGFCWHSAVDLADEDEEDEDEDCESEEGESEEGESDSDSDTDSSVISDEAAVMVKTTAQDRDIRMAQKEERARHVQCAELCRILMAWPASHSWPQSMPFELARRIAIKAAPPPAWVVESIYVIRAGTVLLEVLTVIC